jgi:hypothetical protein
MPNLAARAQDAVIATANEYIETHLCCVAASMSNMTPELLEELAATRADLIPELPEADQMLERANIELFMAAAELQRAAHLVAQLRVLKSAKRA